MIFSGLRKNSPYTSQINQAILKLQENGVISISSISADHHFYVYHNDRGHDYDIGKLTMKYDVGHYTKGDSGVDDVQAEKPEQERVIELYFSVYPRDHDFDHDHDCQNMLRWCTDFDRDHVQVMHKLKNRWWKERGAKNCKALRNAPKGANALKVKH